jgi:outer membrane protein assembly factor BamD (BamD/ComL family)
VILPNRFSSVSLKLKPLSLSLVCVGLALSLGGCSSGLGNLLGGDSKPPVSADLGNSSDQAVASLYNDGLSNLNNGQYRTAVKKFAELERLHPYSKWATKALLMQGFAHYQNNEYVDAIMSALHQPASWPPRYSLRLLYFCHFAI